MYFFNILLFQNQYDYENISENDPNFIKTPRNNNKTTGNRISFNNININIEDTFKKANIEATTTLNESPFRPNNQTNNANTLNNNTNSNSNSKGYNFDDTTNKAKHFNIKLVDEDNNEKKTFSKSREIFFSPNSTKNQTNPYFGSNLFDNKHRNVNITKADSFSMRLANPETRQPIKLFLNEVKLRISSDKFKEFVKCIKLITSKQTNDRAGLFREVKLLFGEQNVDLYLKFEKILAK